MSDLMTFLRARLDEDERVAKDASCQHWVTNSEHNVYEVESNNPVAIDPWSGDLGADGVHIARHDPARVLAEVEAKRQIIAEFERRESWLNMRTLVGEARDLAVAMRDALSPVLRLLTLPYADHPEYQPEWTVASNAAKR